MIHAMTFPLLTGHSASAKMPPRQSFGKQRTAAHSSTLSLQDAFLSAAPRFSGNSKKQATQNLLNHIADPYVSPEELHQDIERFLQQGAEPGREEQQGQNALHKLAAMNYFSPRFLAAVRENSGSFEPHQIVSGDLLALPKTFRMLIDAGCDFQAADAAGYAPWELLASNGKYKDKSLIPELKGRQERLNQLKRDLADKNVQGVLNFLMEGNGRMTPADVPHAALPFRLFDIPENVAFIKKHCKNPLDFLKAVCERELTDDMYNIAENVYGTRNLTEDDGLPEEVARELVARQLPPENESVLARLKSWLKS